MAHHPAMAEIVIADPSLVVLVGAAGAGQVDVRGTPFRPRRDPVVGPLPGDRLGRRGEPGRDQGGVQRAPRGAGSASRGWTDCRRRRDEHRTIGAPLAPRARDGGRRPGLRDRPRPAGGHGPRAERGAARPGRRPGGRPPASRASARLTRRPGAAHRHARGSPRSSSCATRPRSIASRSAGDPDGRPHGPIGRARPRCRRSRAIARAIPTACVRVTRSRRKTVARITVITG